VAVSGKSLTFSAKLIVVEDLEGHDTAIRNGAAA